MNTVTLTRITDVTSERSVSMNITMPTLIEIQWVYIIFNSIKLLGDMFYQINRIFSTSDLINHLVKIYYADNYIPV